MVLLFMVRFNCVCFPMSSNKLGFFRGKERCSVSFVILDFSEGIPWGG